MRSREVARGEVLRGEPSRGERARGKTSRGEPVRGEPVRGEPVRGERASTAGVPVVETDPALPIEIVVRVETVLPAVLFIAYRAGESARWTDAAYASLAEVRDGRASATVPALADGTRLRVSTVLWPSTGRERYRVEIALLQGGRECKGSPLEALVGTGPESGVVLVSEVALA